MFVILVGLLAAGGLAGCIYWSKNNSNSYDDGPLFLGMACIGVLIAVVIAWLVVYTTSLAMVGNLKGTRDSIPSYCTAIHAAQAAVIDYPQNGIVDLTYQEQAAKYTQMVADLRDRVTSYNRDLSTWKTLRASLLTNWMVADLGSFQPLSADCE